MSNFAERQECLNWSLQEWESRGLQTRNKHEQIQFLSSLEIIRKLPLRPGMQIVDVGAGPGHQSFIFKQLGLEVRCVDLRPPAYPELPFSRPDEIDAAGTAFDLIWSHHCLEHIPDPLRALRTWHGWLKREGHLCVTVPDFYCTASTGHINLYNLPLLVYHLAAAGFDCRGKSFQRRRSHLRAYVRRASGYDPHTQFTLALEELARHELFSPSITRAIQKTGRFSLADIHLNWFGEVSQPSKNSTEAYEFFADALWKSSTST